MDLVRRPTYRGLIIAAMCQIVMSLTGCGSDDGGNAAKMDGGTGGDGGVGPAFAIGTGVFGEQEAAYVLLTPEIDRNGAAFTLEQAREFPGESDLTVLGDNIYIANGDRPEIAKYSVDANLALQDVPPPVSFGAYGVASAAFWNHQFISPTKAYLINLGRQIIVWNPTSMQVETTIDLPQLPVRDTLMPVSGLADRSSIVHNGKFYLPFYWTDSSYAFRSADSVIMVVDIASGTVEGTIPAPCPGLDYVTADDSGKLHFSNWTGGVGAFYLLKTAQNCIATLDPATGNVTTKTFASIAAGHEGAAFKYAGNGRFVMSVFDEVRADIANAVDPASAVGGTFWQLWSYDPATGQSAPVAEVDWNSGAIIHSAIGTEMYSSVPGADYKNTVVYKLLDNGRRAQSAYSITGWSFRLFQVR